MQQVPQVLHDDQTQGQGSVLHDIVSLGGPSHGEPVPDWSLAVMRI